jgi:hypothetical protein
MHASKHMCKDAHTCAQTHTNKKEKQRREQKPELKTCEDLSEIGLLHS